MNEYINNIETLEQLIEEHKNCKTKVKIYEFDNTSYTLLLIEINKILKENQKLQKENQQLKQQLEQRDNIINKAREKIKLLGKFNGETCTRGFQMWVADFNNLLEILNIDKGDE